jgi:hypothetical protein
MTIDMVVHDYNFRSHFKNSYKIVMVVVCVVRHVRDCECYKSFMD